MNSRSTKLLSNLTLQFMSFYLLKAKINNKIRKFRLRFNEILKNTIVILFELSELISEGWG